jgi:hypothetical protein
MSSQSESTSKQCDDSMLNHFEEINNDTNQQGTLRDPLHVPTRPITRLKAKKVKEVINKFI